MDFISSIIKRPISIVRPQSRSTTPSTPPSSSPKMSSATAAEAATHTSERDHSVSPSPLISLAMNQSFNAELNDLLDSTSDDLVHFDSTIEETLTRQHQVSTAAAAATKTTLTVAAVNEVNIIDQVLSEIDLNLNEIDGEEHQQFHPLSPLLAVKANTVKPLSMGPEQHQQQQQQAQHQQGFFQGGSVSTVGQPKSPVEMNQLNGNGQVRGGEPLRPASGVKLSGLPEFDEAQIPELPVSSAELDGHLNTEIDQIPGGAGRKCEPEYNSDSDVFVECISVNSDKGASTEHSSQMESYCSALNDNPLNATLERIAREDPLTPMNNSFEPMDVDDINTTMEILKGVLEPEHHQLLKDRILNETLAQGNHQQQINIENLTTLVEQSQQSPLIATPEKLTIVSDMELNALKSVPLPEEEEELEEEQENAETMPLPNQTWVDPLSISKISNESIGGGNERCTTPNSPSFPFKTTSSQSVHHFPRTPSPLPENDELPYLEKLIVQPSNEKYADIGGVISKSPIEVQVTEPSPEKKEKLLHDETLSMTSSCHSLDAQPGNQDVISSITDRRTFSVDIPKEKDPRRTIVLSSAKEEEPIAGDSVSLMNAAKSVEEMNNKDPRRTIVLSVAQAEASKSSVVSLCVEETQQGVQASPAHEVTEEYVPNDDFEPMDVDTSMVCPENAATQPLSPSLATIIPRQTPLSPPIPTLRGTSSAFTEFLEAQSAPLAPQSPSSETATTTREETQSSPSIASLRGVSSAFNEFLEAQSAPLAPQSPSSETATTTREQTPSSPSIASLRGTSSAFTEFLEAQCGPLAPQSPPLPTATTTREQTPSSPSIASLRGASSAFNEFLEAQCGPLAPQSPSSETATTTREQTPSSPSIASLRSASSAFNEFLEAQSAPLSPQSPSSEIATSSHDLTPNATVILEEEKLSAKEQAALTASSEKDDVFVNHFGALSPVTDDIFKAPQYTSSTFSVLAAAAAKATEEHATSDQKTFNGDFHGNNLILNSSDLDYLFTKGGNNGPVDRSSLLLKFDPLLGAPVPVNLHTQHQQHHHHLQLLPNNLENINTNTRTTLSPTIEEQEQTLCNSKSFVIQAKNCAKFEKGAEEVIKPPVDRTKKHAKMSVNVIENDCNKTFEFSNLNPADKANDYNNMDELEKKIKNEVTKSEDIERKLKEAEQREEALIKRITDKDKTNTKLNGVIEAYEKAIAELISEKEQSVTNYERQLQEVQADRDSNYHHLTSLESTFSDLHIKYEKSKEMTLQLKQIEETLLSERKQTQDNLRMQEQRYEKMKSHAMQQLEFANKKLDTISKEHADEVKKLKALLKKEEVSRVSIAEQLQQKSRENADLVKICEELIYGKGQGGSS